MSKATADTAKGVKMFSSDVVAALLMSTGTTTLSMKNYELMSALDGTKTANGFQHDFRAVIAKAKDLKNRIDDGEVFQPVQPGKKRSGDTMSPATPRKRKVASDEDTPTKKRTTKATPKAGGKKAQVEVAPDDDLGGEGFPQDADEFIKNEQDWEEKFV